MFENVKLVGSRDGSSMMLPTAVCLAQQKMSLAGEHSRACPVDESPGKSVCPIVSLAFRMATVEIKADLPFGIDSCPRSREHIQPRLERGRRQRVLEGFSKRHSKTTH